ncbi:MAG: hypothetical protein ACE5HB_05450, partial [Terriglobia bacterium]
WADIFYAQNISAGANTVTVDNAGTAHAAIHEYSGLDTSSVLDGTSCGTGTWSVVPDSGNVTTVTADELLAATYSGESTRTLIAGTNYTSRETIGGVYMSEDRIVTATGTYSATFDNEGPGNGTEWSVCLATFQNTGGAPADEVPLRRVVVLE